MYTTGIHPVYTLVDTYFKNVNVIGNIVPVCNDSSFWQMRLVSMEKAPSMFDCFETQFGERPEDVVDEEFLHERVVLADSLLLGRDFMKFVIFALPGHGKSMLLRYLHWRVTCRQEEVLLSIEKDASTFYYNEDPATTFFPRNLISLYVNSTYLWKNLESQPLLKALVNSTISTFYQIQGDDSQKLEKQNERNLYEKYLCDQISHSRVVLLLDSLEGIPVQFRFNFLETIGRLQLETSMRNSLQVYLYRVIVCSHPFALHNQKLAQFMHLWMSPNLKTAEKKLRFLKQIENSSSDKIHIVADTCSTSTGIVHFSEPEISKETKFTLHQLQCPCSLALYHRLQKSHKSYQNAFSLYAQIFELHIPVLNRYKNDLNLETSTIQKLLSFVGYLYMCTCSSSVFNHNFPFSESGSFPSIVIRVFRYLYEQRNNFFEKVFENLSPDGSKDIQLWKFVKSILLSCNMISSPASLQKSESNPNAVASDDYAPIFFTSSFMVHFLTAAFLVDSQFSDGLLQLLEKSSLPFSEKLFLWHRLPKFVNYSVWDRVFDLMSSKKGVLWISTKIFKHTTGTPDDIIIDENNRDDSAKLLATYLESICTSGMDVNDLGQVRFSTLLRLFSMEILGESEQSQHVRQLARMFGMAMAAMLSRTPSAVVHLENYPTNTLCVFPPEQQREIITHCFGMLQRNTGFVASDLMLKFYENGLIEDTDLENIRSIILDKTHNATKSRKKLPSLHVIQQIAVRERPTNSNGAHRKKLVSKVLIEVVSQFYPLITTNSENSEEYVELLEEALNGIVELAYQSLAIVKEHHNIELKSLQKNLQQSQIQSQQNLPTDNVHRHWMNHMTLLSEEGWSGVINSSITVLTNILSRKSNLGIDGNSDSSVIFQSLLTDKATPACRAYQYKHLPYIISLLETSSFSSGSSNFDGSSYADPTTHAYLAPLSSSGAGTRLLAHLILSDTTTGNNFQKQSEENKLQAVSVILEAFSKYWKSDRPEAEIINEISKSDPVNQIVANVISVTLGSNAAEACVLLEEIVKTKVDLLTTCATWVWHVLDKNVRQKLFQELSEHSDHLVRCQMIFLCSQDCMFDPSLSFPRDLFASQTTTDEQEAHTIDDDSINIICTKILLNTKETMLVLRQSLQFLEKISQNSREEKHLIKVIETCMTLLHLYGGANQFYSETVFRILRDLFARKLPITSFDPTSSLAPTVSTIDRLLHLMENNSKGNLKIFLMKHFQKNIFVYRNSDSAGNNDDMVNEIPMVKKTFWLGTICALELLQKFCTNISDLETLSLFLAFLLSGEIQLRNIAVSSLISKEISSETVINLLTKYITPILFNFDDDFYNNNFNPNFNSNMSTNQRNETPFVSRSIVQLVGLLGSRPDQAIQNCVLQLITQLLKTKFYTKQVLALAIISVMGSRCISQTKFQRKKHAKKSKIGTDDNTDIVPLPNFSFSETEIPLMLLEMLNFGIANHQEMEFHTHGSTIMEHLLVHTVNTVGDIGLSNRMEIILAFFGLLAVVPSNELRGAIYLAFKKLVPTMPKSHIPSYEATLKNLLANISGTSPWDDFICEVALKVVILFGPSTALKCKEEILAITSGGNSPTSDSGDKLKEKKSVNEQQQAFCRKQGLKNIGLILRHLKKTLPLKEFKTEALSYLPIIIDSLRESDSTVSPTSSFGSFSSSNLNNPPPISASGQVIVQALKLLSIYKTNLLLSRDHIKKNSDGESNEGNDTCYYSMTWEDIQDSFYTNEVIEPNLKVFTSLFQTKKYRANKDVRIELLRVLGDTPHLSAFVPTAYTQILNTDQISTLVEFAEALQELGPHVLQYIPLIIGSVKSSSPLVRHLLKLLQKHAKSLSGSLCDKLFTNSTLTNMMKHRDPTVRKVAVQLVGKKCLIDFSTNSSQKSGNLWLLAQMWADKNSKVKKEVMDALGDIGKHFPELIPSLLQLPAFENVHSVIVWRNLSMAWRTFISIPSIANRGISDDGEE